MFSLSSLQEHKGEVKTLSLKRNPLLHGLGHYEDVNGNKWDVKCIFGNNGNPYVCARPVTNTPYYSTSSTSHSFGIHTWTPYYFKIIK